jgi:hypothetical protein
MYARIGCFFVFLAMACAGVGSAYAEFPGRKSGLWEAVTSGEGIPESVTRECVDQASDKAAIGQPKGPVGESCKLSNLESSDTGFQAVVTCAMSGSELTVRTVGSGDFNSAVTYTVTSSFNPPFMGQGSRALTISSTYKGPCPAGLQPGDVEMNGGMKYTKADQERLAKQAQEMMSNPEIRAAMQRAMGAQQGK